MYCKGFCQEFLKKNFFLKNYKNGFKSCTSCEYFIKTKETFCFCCGHSYRTKPRNRPSYYKNF